MFGETIVKKGRVYTCDALETLTEISIGDGAITKRHTLRPQVLRATAQDVTWTYYLASELLEFDTMMGTRTVHGGLKVPHGYSHEVALEASKTRRESPRGKPGFSPRRSSGTPKMLKLWFYNFTFSRDARPYPDLRFTRATALDRPSFQQEFIYSGRSGETLRFVYREFVDSLIRPAFTQEVQYDLSEGRVVGFRELRVEVLDATNTTIRYRVIENFADPQR